MKQILCILILICFMFSAAACGKKKPENTLEEIMERGYLKAGVRVDAEPFGFINEAGENEGFDIDTAEYIAEKLLGSPDKLVFLPVSAAERIETLTSKKADIIIAAMSNTPERQNIIDFTEPYYTAGQTAVVSKKSSIYSFADLKDKIVITASGSTAKKNLRRVIPSARIAEYKNYNEAFQALKQGEGDALCADDTIISGFILHNKDFRALNSRISSEKYSIGIQKTEDKTLLRKLNSIINEMNTYGIFKEFKKKRNLS